MCRCVDVSLSHLSTSIKLGFCVGYFVFRRIFSLVRLDRVQHHLRFQRVVVGVLGEWSGERVLREWKAGELPAGKEGERAHERAAREMKHACGQASRRPDH